MVATTQSERIKAANKSAALRKETNAEEVAIPTPTSAKYSKELLVQIAAAIIQTDKSYILNAPALVIKSKAILDEINA